jgi:ribulose-phosphate 3-epimerase
MNGIYPSLISSNLLALGTEVQQLEPYAAGFHLDVMDFHFVPNLTWGPDFINALRKVTDKKLWVHLMVDYPEKYFERLKLSPHDIVTIHLESPSSLSITSLCTTIKSYNWIPSIALNPHTPLEALIALPVALEHVLLMSVQPGFSGQTFLPFVLHKLKALNAFRQAHNLSFTIGLDGGITQEKILELKHLGANQLAVASALFNTSNPRKTLKNLSLIFT